MRAGECVRRCVRILFFSPFFVSGCGGGLCIEGLGAEVFRTRRECMYSEVLREFVVE